MAIELTMEKTIDGAINAFKPEMELEGFDGVKYVHTPFPEDLYLSLFDPAGDVTDAEAAAIKNKGFNTVVGILLWVVRMTHLEGKTGTHYLSKVLSRPSKLAWNAAIHVLQWLDQNRLRGI